MRFFLLFAAVVGLACGATLHKAPKHAKIQPLQTRDLQDDFNDLLALLPIDEILSITLNYIANDAEVQQLIAYFQSDSFETIVTYVDSQPEYLTLLDMAYQRGLTDIYDFVNSLHELFNIPPIEGVPATKARRSIHKRSLDSYFEELAAVIPIDDIRALWNDKLQTSTDFQEIYAYVSSEEFHNFLLRVDALPELQAFGDALRAVGIDVDAVLEYIRQIFGWDVTAKKFVQLPRHKVRLQARDRQEVLNDLVALIPVEEILSIALNYLANDAEVQEALVYLESDDFETIIVYIDAQPEFLNLLDFLYTHGLTDIYTAINSLHVLLGIPELQVPARKIKRSIHKRSLVSFVDEIIAALPIDDILALINDKLQTSEDFQELVAIIGSEDFHQFLLRVEALPETQELGQRLRDLGFDVDAILQFIRDVFGWN